MLQDIPAELPEVVVTAARLPPAEGEAAFAVIRLNRSDLDQARRLDEALFEVPAVSLFRRTSSLAANPTTQGLSLRAIAPSGAGRTLVTLDGVPLNDPFGGWVIWSQLPPEAVESVDVVRGSGAGPYGAGALTGVLALRERDADGVLDLSVAEDEGRRLAASTRLSAGRFALTGSVLAESSAGYTPVRGPSAGAADTPLDLETRSASMRLDTALSAHDVLSARVSAYDEDRGSGLAGARSHASGQGYSATLSRRPGEDRLGWRVQAWRRESDFANSSVAVAADRSGTTPANDQYATPAVGWGGNVAVRGVGRAVAGGRLEWEAGADARLAEGETRERFRYMAGDFTRDRFAGGETRVVGGYAEASWRSDAWLVAGGVRLDRWENRNGRRLERDRATGAATLDETDPARSGEVFSARLAARRQVTRDWAVRAAAYSGFRPATLNELHRPFRVGNDLTEANAALAPERLRGIEAGLAWSPTWGEATLTVFANRIEDAIVNVTVGQGPATFPRAGFVPAGGVLRRRDNAGTIEAVGIEAAVGGHLGERLAWTLAAALTEAEMDGGAAAPQLSGLRPAQAPRATLTAGLDWRATDRLALSVRARHESDRFEDDLNSRVLEAATTLDARADWRLTNRARLYLAADNLTDEDVQVSETADGVEGFGPPRTVRLGLTLGW